MAPINRETVSDTVQPRIHLADFLRDLGLTGTHLGCEHGVCGACTVRGWPCAPTVPSPLGPKPAVLIRAILFATRTLALSLT